ncbi:H-type small acid-soluble spore protein [Evansella cellulosilytica]|uniref:Small, acid-soluble spore protein H n=1 Tax=Evansella cellulosilytica (strain ATCC 21833 / DSM 2522 / FERM P-1141 / JCM 9156 / N-4) TaxID=649639 RepID=E6TZ07_EVAC2|nr:H-type small acid-soluble spore protein [Evansella cellulosilytica]ADU32450.1 small acid-soluble spore protein, H-type [Evansella cellulosilytica DSM 2522]
MDTQRAQEIIESPAMINVSYHGIPVYIKEVDANSGKARIFPLDEMENEQDVDVQGLTEG